MDRKKAKGGSQKNIGRKKPRAKSEATSYRLKCAKTANGLSHFVMYGDVTKDKAPV